MQSMITVSGVGKHYVAYASNLHRFANWFGAKFQPRSEFWANRDISFSLQPGEALALIGQNGAGKSTLLKMLTGTVRPSTGAISVNGRVGAILELGIGFNPEFTGRENILNAGGLIGHSSELLQSLMPEIEAFAELGEFFDQPLRVYSSGMQARLAFSLVTAVRPDVLIIDEVLSVGDSYFQHKSFGRIRQFKDQGTAIILVTHGLGDVRALCDRVILLDKGRMIKDGPPDEVVDYYNALTAEKENAKRSIEQRRQDGWGITVSGDKRAKLERMTIRDAVTGEELKTVRVNQLIDIHSEVRVFQPIPQLVVGHMLRDRTGHEVWGTNTWHTRQILKELVAGQMIRVTFRFYCNVGPGSYGVTYNLVSTDTWYQDNFDSCDNYVVFDVVNADFPVFVGTTWIDAKITLEVD